MKLTHFFPESSEDTWFQAALTVQGKIGNFDMVYAGAYLDRNDEIRLRLLRLRLLVRRAAAATAVLQRSTTTAT